MGYGNSEDIDQVFEIITDWSRLTMEVKSGYLKQYMINTCPKWPMGSGKQLSLNKFFDPSTPSMRKGRDGEKRKKNGKNGGKKRKKRRKYG